MIRFIDRNFDRSEWNKYAVHPMQSWEWGVAREKMGIEVLRLMETAEKTKNVFLITLHRVPKTPYKVGYIPRSVPPSKEVIDFLYDYGKRNNIISVKTEPNKTAAHEWRPDRRKVVLSPAPLFPKWTQIIDLSKSEDEILKNMKPKTRYNIRLAQRKGLKVLEMSDAEGFNIFSDLYFETTKRQRYFGHNREYHKIIFNSLRDSIAHILIVFNEGKPLGAYELFLFNNVLYYPYGGSSVEQKEVMAPNLIMWEAIRFGKKYGATSFDLWGSLPPDYDTKHIWAGFTRFKEGYGAKFTEMIGSYDIVISPLLYKGFTFAQKIREKLMIS